MRESKECRHCHRIGYRGFVPGGDYGWVCARDDLCRTRAAIRRLWPVTTRAPGMRAGLLLESVPHPL